MTSFEFFLYNSFILTLFNIYLLKIMQDDKIQHLHIKSLVMLFLIT